MRYSILQAIQWMGEAKSKLTPSEDTELKSLFKKVQHKALAKMMGIAPDPTKTPTRAETTRFNSLLRSCM